ncbi:uncharacterized protein M421DRAFT_372699 [Didymella exigua CBS 183.55]|uniref:Uncharacterized protein n=1 Tax=Didymella exigua CBS 183.55 TaxID=1150837 RepID=A0A6A5RPM4_9PLEO|nr:uncharacterized protein M421DRAFT_372699 [Didymella exigua CBS 183.55]KAF1930371.1 hypothetical protein M421DRAFT_372699 [Didymella exigua CBS 183.55]
MYTRELSAARHSISLSSPKPLIVLQDEALVASAMTLVGQINVRPVLALRTLAINLSRRVASRRPGSTARNVPNPCVARSIKSDLRPARVLLYIDLPQSYPHLQINSDTGSSNGELNKAGGSSSAHDGVSEHSSETHACSFEVSRISKGSSRRTEHSGSCP